MIITGIDCKNCTYYKKLQELEEENKRLKQQYNCYACDTCNGKEDYRNMKRHCENAIKTVHKYQEAIKKVRDYIKEICKEECDYTKPKFCGDCDCRYGQILDNVNEVLK